MKNTLLNKLTLLLLLLIGMISCSKYEEDITIEKIHYASKVNPCELSINNAIYGNPNSSEYSAFSNLGLLTIEYKKSKFDKKILAINENEKLIETSVNINSLVVDMTNGDLYECTNGSVYTVDGGDYSKNLVVNSEDLKTTGNYVINNSILYLTQRRNEGKTIDLIEYNLITNEHSILHTETRQDERKYYNPITFGSKNNKVFLSIHSADDKSRYIQTYSLDNNEIAWEADIGNVINSSRWLTGGKYFADASFDVLKAYDMATGVMTFEMSLEDYSYVGIVDDHAIIERNDKYHLINLKNGIVTYQNKGGVINSFNSTIYSVNKDNQFEAYNLKTNKNLFCTNLNDIEESENFNIWSLAPQSRHIIGTTTSCDLTELLVLKY